MMCLKTERTASVTASRLFHFQATHAPKYLTFIMEQKAGYGPWEKGML